MNQPAVQAASTRAGRYRVQFFIQERKMIDSICGQLSAHAWLAGGSKAWACDRVQVPEWTWRIDTLKQGIC